MNCRRIEELIPLYVEGDLEGGRKEEMRSHLAACERCGALFDQYRESQAWLRSCSTPGFDAAFFDGLRESVLTGIEREQSRPSFFQLAAGPWRWNTALATAAALLLVLGAIAFYVFQAGTGNGRGNREQVVTGPVRKDEPPPVNGNQEAPEAAPQPDPRPDRRVVRHKPARREPVEAASKDIEPPLISEAIETIPEIGEVDPVIGPEAGAELIAPPATPPGMTRIEIQTSDPTIRIIWFAPRVTDSKLKKRTIDSDQEAL
ncbi:MAG TPA: zf-HC2 domain-containing protein [Blastocatellia bacterium]|nr:zf-HC2 domain-containing protein [Blastocatellia bacterium]